MSSADKVVTDNQILLPLSAIGIMKRKREHKLDGNLLVYLPDTTKFKIPFSNEDTIRVIKERIESNGINLSNFLCVSKYGTLHNNDASAKEMRLTNDSRIILVKKAALKNSKVPTCSSALLKKSNQKSPKIFVPKIKNSSLEAHVF